MIGNNNYSLKNYGKPIGNYSAVMIVDAIVDNIKGRSGGDHWWDSIDEEIQLEIKDEWEKIVQGVRHHEDLEMEIETCSESEHVYRGSSHYNCVCGKEWKECL